jgi:hypothetical protein
MVSIRGLRFPFKAGAQAFCSSTNHAADIVEDAFIEFSHGRLQDEFVHECSLENWQALAAFVSRDARAAHSTA